MEKSGSIINLAKALIKFSAECPKIPKKSKNPFFNSMYAGLPDIQDAIGPVLVSNGLVYAQHPEPGDVLTTIVIHADSGEFMQSTININPVYEYKEEKDSNKKVVWRSDKPHITPQSMGSAITYAKRYALVAIFGLNVDDDDDGNAGSGNITDTKNKKVETPPPINTPEKKVLSPDNKKEWTHQILNLQNKKYNLEQIASVFNITDADKALLLKQGNKSKPTLKAGSNEWNSAVAYLAIPNNKIEAITWKYEISDQDLTDLQTDVMNYTPAETPQTETK